MRRTATVAFTTVFALGLVALLLVANGERRSEAFTLGVTPASVLKIPVGGTICQLPIDVPAAFDGIRLRIGTYRREGQALGLTVRDASSREVVSSGSIPGGYPDLSTLLASVDRVDASRAVAVCVRNRGSRRTALYGNAAAANRSSSAYVNGQDIGSDIALVFTRAEPASLLSLVPDVVERAALFHGDWIQPWTLWVLLIALVVGLPALLIVALRTAVPDDT